MAVGDRVGGAGSLTMAAAPGRKPPPLQNHLRLERLCECFCTSVCTGVEGWRDVQPEGQRATLNVLDDLLCFISSALRLLVAGFLVISVFLGGFF